MSATTTAPARDALAGTARERVRRRKDAGAALTLLGPSLVILGVMVGYPAVLMLVQSFTDYSIRNKIQGTAPDVVGFDNYLAVFTQSDFPAVLVRSLGLMLVMTLLIVGLGTVVALLLTRLSRGWRTLVSVGLLLAWAMPPLAATTVWGWIFDTRYGLVNWALNAVTGSTAFTNHSWLLDPWSFFVVLTIIVVWQGIPFAAFTLYAGLGQVPPDVLEAASLDGATGRQRFRLVVFPYLRNVFTVVVVLQVIWNMRIFTQVYTLQQRGGLISETNVLGTYIFRQGVGEFGVTSAIGVLMVILLLALSWGYVRTTLREEEP
ncbi:carbohydrate ABC transporter permease [Microbacterium sp. 179-B 1A2 NHS]|uniref:carbohydrate ABC transporter permease n=1 Tax=Microbacterium sp. 179-B 1A2 NHS TaxID=3142383 RepID=UPI00399F4135